MSTNAPSNRKTILTIGLSHLPPPTMQNLGGSLETIIARVQESMRKTEEAGFIIEPCLVPGRDAEADDAIATVEKKLAEKGKELDGIMVGFGVRGTPEYTVMFERLIRLLCEKCPELKVGFNSGPDDLYEAVVRNFGHSGKS